MKVQIIPDIKIDNTRVVGFIENTHFYRNLINRFSVNKEYVVMDEQYITSYEILITKENISFFLDYDDRIAANIETELNICWKNATFKPIQKPTLVLGETKELELTEHYFLSLKTDLRGEFPLSNILESQNILKDNEQILIRLEFKPISPTWHREIEEHIKNFKKGKVASKNVFSIYDIGVKVAEIAVDTVYSAIDFASSLIVDEKAERETIANNKYAKLLRNGLSSSTQEKSKYNAYNASFIITINSCRSDLLFRNMERSFNSMEGDNSFKLVNQSNYRNILCSKEIAQIMQMPTKAYQDVYRINNIDNREIDIPNELQNGRVSLGTATKNGRVIHARWPTNKNIKALPKILVGPQNAGKTTKTVRYAVENHKAGDSVIVIDYIQNNELASEIEKHIPENERITIDMSDRDNIFAMAYTEATKMLNEHSNSWERLEVANLLSSQIEYLINSVTDKATGELTAPMLRYLYAAAMVVFIHPGKTINDVFQVLRRWQIRNEYIRLARYSNCFDADDDIFYDLDELHQRDSEGKITGTKENLIIGIINRITMINKNIYLKAMLKAPIDENIDFIRFIEEGKSILIKIPQRKFPDVKIRDTLATYFLSRIWLAVQLRKQNLDVRLAHLIIDEVHQIPTCSSFIKEYINEFRRHRLGTFFTVHYLKQFRSLLEAVKSGGVSYMLLAGVEKENLKMLEQEILPFTIQEGLSLKPYHSLNVINYGNQYSKFISKLPKPI
ncbi:hypothetical protein [Tepidibacter hydrothermalis]|uniref:Uncharacterized protein n=1 Tax=Tepidibacter hydrothermalis TaxID=3036126 RepID=A0ABY8EL78_9FIRM|nr:hypothetical protein [Tepidibacter hydrothermalis]WFD12028.1 hypothetical protein P4S50_08105 [Tepidibacter hydrothermalis]